MKNHFQTWRAGRTQRGAFTLIELLVVVAIVGILAGLILATTVIAKAKAARAKAETELKALEAAIQTYKNKKGHFPQDNTNSTWKNPLFYELTGSIYNPTAGSFTSPVTQETFLAADVQTAFGRGGFANASPDPAEVDNFLPAVAKSGMTGKFFISGNAPPTYTIFGNNLKGPLQLSDNNGKFINPWHYVSTNPTNNDGSFDLWIDVSYSGKTNRINNWTKDPEVIGP